MIAAGLCVFSCLAAPVSADGFFLDIGSGETPFAEAALVNAFTVFFGAPPDADTRRRFRLNLGGGAGGLTPGGRRIGIGYRFVQDQGRVRLTTTARLSWGARSFRFADGIGIFRDPAQIRTRYRQLALEQAVSTRLWRRGALDLRSGVGAGVLLSDYDISISSALLKVRASGQDASGVVRVFADMGVQGGATARPRLVLSISRYEGGLYDLTFFTRLRF